MMINVCYRVPVVAVVDTTSGEIVRVVVDDESISKPEYCERADTCQTINAKSKTAQRAVEIAESQMWPSWSFGF